MVNIELWDNEKIELLCRETRRENEIIPIIKKIFYHDEPLNVRYIWGCGGERYVIHGLKYNLIIKFTSKKQLNKFTEFMSEINNGEIEEVYCR